MYCAWSVLITILWLKSVNFPHQNFVAGAEVCAEEGGICGCDGTVTYGRKFVAGAIYASPILLQSNEE